jgi:dienelactone hydrolase
MNKRPIATGLYVAAFVFLGLAALLVNPADIAEFFLGFFAPPLVVVQLTLVGVGIMFALIATKLDVRKTPLAIFAAAAALICIHRAWRELGAYSREGATIVAGTNTLDGTLYVPRDLSAKRPAVLMLHGSGRISRDAYHLFADRLARAGHIVLNVDKRGVRRSTGKYYGDNTGKKIPLEHRADDMAAALAFLRRDARVDAKAVGVFGISQGGWVLPLLAQRDSALAFAVIMSGPAVSTGEEELFSELTNENKDHFGRNPPPIPFDELDRRLRATTPTGYDPRADLGNMKTPTLWLLGDWDSSSPTDATARVLDSLARGGAPFTVRRFAEANHGLFIVRGPHARRLSRFAPGLWDTIGTWLNARTNHRLTAR